MAKKKKMMGAGPIYSTVQIEDWEVFEQQLEQIRKCTYRRLVDYVIGWHLCRMVPVYKKGRCFWRLPKRGEKGFEIWRGNDEANKDRTAAGWRGLLEGHRG